MINEENQSQPETQAEAVETQDQPNTTVEGSAGDDTVVGAGADAGTPAETPAVESDAVQPEPETVPAAAAVVTPPPATKPQQRQAVGINSPLEDYVLGRHKHLKEMPKATQGIAARMEEYCTAMAKTNAMNKDTGALHQRNLYLTILTALSGPEETVMPSLETICWYFNKNRNDCFAASHAYRFTNAVKLSKDEMLLLNAFIHVFTLAANPATRKEALKQVDLGRATEKMTDARMRDLLLAFMTA